MYNLVYNGYNNQNGALTFTAHLFKLIACDVYRPSISGRKKLEFPFPYKSVKYNELPEEFLVTQFYGESEPEFEFKLKAMEQTVVVHDDRKQSIETALTFSKKGKVITIREAVHLLLNSIKIKNTLLPMPYVRVKSNGKHSKKAISISRISSDKHTEIIIKHNLLAEKRGIEPIIIAGPITSPIYEYRKLRKIDENWKRNYIGEIPNEMIVETLSGYKYVVDMTYYKREGGGTQYTTLEAFDADCTFVCHRNWLQFAGELQENENCLAVFEENELLELLEEGKVISGKDVLEKHKGEEWLK